jgi:hypothetical protein
MSVLKSAGYKQFEISITLNQLAFIFLNADNTGPHSVLVSLLMHYTKGEGLAVMHLLLSVAFISFIV